MKKQLLLLTVTFLLSAAALILISGHSASGTSIADKKCAVSCKQTQKQQTPATGSFIVDSFSGIL